MMPVKMVFISLKGFESVWLKLKSFIIFSFFYLIFAVGAEGNLILSISFIFYY